ncbi:recombinase family protein [Nonomuraea sp. NPDC049725]|uniref:recombinase family protein n=1 Tax=Nonomuraea sp. NPDC049725 TaxID=3154508 RepID=UPI00343D1E62
MPDDRPETRPGTFPMDLEFSGPYSGRWRSERLPAAPTVPSNAIRVGYARVSTRDQDHAAQLQLLNGADCCEIVEETISTRRKDRPKLIATLDGMKPGDTLVITKPGQVARSVKELLVFVEDQLAPRGINLHILTGICAGIHRPNGQTMGDKMLFLVAAMAAEMERDLIGERTNEGLDAARTAGRVGGRPAKVTDDVLAVARARRARGQSVTQIARELGVGRSTLYRALEDDESGRHTAAHDSAGLDASGPPDPDSDVVLVALADAFGRNVPMRDAFLDDQAPAMREQYWSEVADANERIHQRCNATKTT